MSAKLVCSSVSALQNLRSLKIWFEVWPNDIERSNELVGSELFLFKALRECNALLVFDRSVAPLTSVGLLVTCRAVCVDRSCREVSLTVNGCCRGGPILRNFVGRVSSTISSSETVLSSSKLSRCLKKSSLSLCKPIVDDLQQHRNSALIRHT